MSGTSEPIDNSPKAHRRALLVGAIVTVVSALAAALVTDLTEVLVASAVVGLLTTISMGIFGWAGRRRNELSSHKDALTGLLNRIGLLEYLEETSTASRRQKTTTAVLFCDLDRFKVINDSMGHEAGDELLRAVGHRILDAVRTTDKVARFGGDEFVVVCDGLIEPSSATTVAQQVLQSFDEPVDLLGSDHVVSPSIGIATSSPEHRRTATELLRDSDAAMYRAKRNRSGYAVFDDEQRRNAMERLDIERALRTGLEAGELEVFYQPIVTHERELTSVEALVRWDRPGFGLVGPDKFLAVAEESGMMGSIGEAVLREACAQAALWNHWVGKGRIRVGVNLEERQLVDSAFPDQIRDILSWSGLPAHQLVLEITEDVMLDHLTDSFRVLNDLKELGVRLAIDDFGTGRSSLSYIKRLDMVDVLKIDKTFVDDIAIDAVDLRIIEAIINLAKAVGLEVVAEGVETSEQASRLRDLGVNGMQGYLFAKPSPAIDLEEALGIDRPDAHRPDPSEREPEPGHRNGVSTPASDQIAAAQDEIAPGGEASKRDSLPGVDDSDDRPPPAPLPARI